MDDTIAFPSSRTPVLARMARSYESSKRAWWIITIVPALPGSLLLPGNERARARRPAGQETATAGRCLPRGGTYGVRDSGGEAGDRRADSLGLVRTDAPESSRSGRALDVRTL